ncbi:AraC family transcriptional regulator [Pseudomonadota bacterium]
MNDINSDKPALTSGFDPLSEVLQLLKLDVSIYHNAKVCGNWHIGDNGQHSSCFHIVTLGRCYLDAPGHYSGQMDEGDLMIFSTALPHTLRPIESLSGEQQHLSFNDSEDVAGTGLLCGDVNFQHRGSQQLLSALPPLLIIRYEQAKPWMKPLLEMVMVENRSPGAVSKAILDRLSELLFTYAVKGFVAEHSDTATMLSLYGDERLALAVKAIHSQPAHDWSLDQLAKKAMMSRTVFAERFKAVSGWTVGQYTIWWRMQLAWDLLHNGKAVSQVAECVGYQSEAAFSRAFKKMFDLSPGKVRRGQDNRL